MIFPIMSLFIPMVLLLFLPLALKSGKKHILILIIACVIFTLSWYLPSPLIEGEQTQFMTHLVGGGVFSGVFWLYLKKVKNWKAVCWIEAISLFVFVSALGVINELFELLLYVFNYMPQGIADTSWDLLANTLGAVLFFAVYLLANKNSFKKLFRI